MDQQAARTLCGAHAERHAATADGYFLGCQRVRRGSRAHEHVLGDQRFASELLGQVLKARGHIHRIAESGEYDVFLVADVADDDVPAIDPDAETDGLAQVLRKLRIELVDVHGDATYRGERAAARRVG